MKIISEDRYNELELELRKHESAIAKTHKEFAAWMESLPKTEPSTQEYLRRSEVIDGYHHCQRQLLDKYRSLADEMNEMAEAHCLAKHLKENHPERPLA